MEKKQAQYNNAFETYTCDNDIEKTTNLKYFYAILSQVTNQSLGLISNITNIRCDFVKNDKNILLNQVDSAGHKGVILCTFGFLIGIFSAISVLTGILFVYKYFSFNNENQNLANNSINESTSNYNNVIINLSVKSNNNAITYPNNNMMNNPK